MLFQPCPIVYPCPWQSTCLKWSQIFLQVLSSFFQHQRYMKERSSGGHPCRLRTHGRIPSQGHVFWPVQEAHKGGYYDCAVSYTHLRAHETRHDLVCRLLLEKK